MTPNFVRIPLCLLAAAPVLAQGRLLGEGQTLDDRAYVFPEVEGAVALGGGHAIVASVTGVPAGGDHAQAFAEVFGARQLALAAVLDPLADGRARAFGVAAAIGAGRAVVGDPDAELGAVHGRVESWALGAFLPAQRAVLLPPEPDLASFGRSLASDGVRLAVTSRAQGPDAVRCFVYGPGPGPAEWTQVARIAVPELAGDLSVFGEGVALSGDRLALGCPWRRGGQGSVLVLREAPGTGLWSVEDELFVAGPIGFGGAVALEGDVLLAGASEAIGPATRGVVFAYRRVGTVWTKTQRIVPVDSAAWDRFGTALALDGGLALIGAPGRPRPNGADGAVDLWTDPTGTGTWSRATVLVDGSARSGDRFGLEVAVDRASSPVRMAVLASLDGRLQGRAVLLPAPLPPLLELDGTAGVAVCAPNGVNSLGTWGKLRALGSAIVARDELTLEAWSLPPHTTLLVAASDGERCASIGATGLVALGGSTMARWTVVATDAAGVARIPVDVGSLPGTGPGGVFAVMSGTAWVFQGHYADVVGARLTEGLRIRFE
jgi:hypothetical protein